MGSLLKDNKLPVVTKVGAFDMQVCVPETWTDEEVTAFTNKENEAGTRNGWFIRRQGDLFLKGDAERVQCSKREGFCHIMLDC